MTVYLSVTQAQAFKTCDLNKGMHMGDWMRPTSNRDDRSRASGELCIVIANARNKAISAAFGATVHNPYPPESSKAWLWSDVFAEALAWDETPYPPSEPDLYGAFRGA
jgi:hypothetical protein